jgi:hypothetical protein
MNVVGLDDVAYDHELITPADCFEHGQKQIAPLRARQPRWAMVTTAGDEVQFLGAVVALGMVGHQASLLVAVKKRCDI